MAPRPNNEPDFDSAENQAICIACPLELCVLDGGPNCCPIGALQPMKYRREDRKRKPLKMVLDALYERGEPMTSAELAEVTGLNRETLEKYCRHGWLVYEGKRPRRITGINHKNT